MAERLCHLGHPAYGTEMESERRADHNILGDPQHPQTRDYVATNLLAHIDRMPNTGDWHGQLKAWAQANSSGDLDANPASAPPGVTEWRVAEKYDETPDYYPADSEDEARMMAEKLVTQLSEEQLSGTVWVERRECSPWTRADARSSEREPEDAGG